MTDGATTSPTSTSPTPAMPAAGDDVTDELDDLDFGTVGEPAESPYGPAPSIVVFDIGEVLIDETRVWAIWADILGVSPFTFAAVLGAAIVQGEGYEEAFAHVAPNVTWMDFTEEHERRYGGFQESDLYRDVRTCLEELQAMSVRIGIAGNQPSIRQAQLLALDLPHDVMAMSDDLTHEKPDPGFFAEVQQLVGAQSPDQVLYVGDRVDNDVIPAHEAGMRTCWLRCGPWGQLHACPDGVEPDLVLDGLGELPLLLQSWADDDA